MTTEELAEAYRERWEYIALLNQPTIDWALKVRSLKAEIIALWNLKGVGRLLASAAAAELAAVVKILQDKTQEQDS